MTEAPADLVRRDELLRQARQAMETDNLAYAEALAQADRPEVAGKNRDAAEEKRVAFAPSGRNTLTALTSSALNNAKIGRSRVSLKYLSRMESRLPAAAGPAEILRDLLSHRALQESGGPAGGQ